MCNGRYGVAVHPNLDAGVCPPKNCSLYSEGAGEPPNTELPAVPFVTAIDPVAKRCLQFATSLV